MSQKILLIKNFIRITLKNFSNSENTCIEMTNEQFRQFKFSLKTD